MKKRADRYPPKRKASNGKMLCRGCGNPVPKGRRTWCSAECYNTLCPSEVIRQVKDRDKGICCMCGCNTIKLELKAIFARRLGRLRGWLSNRYRNKPWRINETNLWRKANDFRSRMIKLGFHRSGSWWQADHIIPFSHGGPTTLENLRTLCVPCHKDVTRKMREKTP